MIVYLDQNKWIELSRIIYGKDTSTDAPEMVKKIRTEIAKGMILPLSATHFLELASISDDGRRQRLGEVMWELSGGNRMISYREIVSRELEIGFSTLFPTIKPRELSLIGKGLAHAFGTKFDDSTTQQLDELLEKSILTGLRFANLPPIKLPETVHRNNFLSHLSTLKDEHTKQLLDGGKSENLLLAMALNDVLEPLFEVLTAHGIQQSDFRLLNEIDYKKALALMPTRCLDMHLRRQIIKNPEYRAKPSDLEDWTGVGVASCYCDIVICEKHFADMLKRDNYRPYARIETKLSEVFGKII